MRRIKVLGLTSIVNKVVKEMDELEEVQEPANDSDKSKDPQLWMSDPDPEHDVELVKVAVPQGWNRGNKTRSKLAVGKHAGRMNRRGVYPDTQKDLGWGDGNERTDKQRD